MSPTVSHSSTTCLPQAPDVGTHLCNSDTHLCPTCLPFVAHVSHRHRMLGRTPGTGCWDTPLGAHIHLSTTCLPCVSHLSPTGTRCWDEPLGADFHLTSLCFPLVCLLLASHLSPICLPYAICLPLVSHTYRMFGRTSGTPILVRLPLVSRLSPHLSPQEPISIPCG